MLVNSAATSPGELAIADCSFAASSASVPSFLKLTPMSESEVKVPVSAFSAVFSVPRSRSVREAATRSPCSRPPALVVALYEVRLRMPLLALPLHPPRACQRRPR